MQVKKEPKKCYASLFILERLPKSTLCRTEKCTPNVKFEARKPTKVNLISFYTAMKIKIVKFECITDHRVQ